MRRLQINQLIHNLLSNVSHSWSNYNRKSQNLTPWKRTEWIHALIWLNSKILKCLDPNILSEETTYIIYQKNEWGDQTRAHDHRCRNWLDCNHVERFAWISLLFHLEQIQSWKEESFNRIDLLGTKIDEYQKFLHEFHPTWMEFQIECYVINASSCISHIYCVCPARCKFIQDYIIQTGTDVGCYEALT